MTVNNFRENLPFPAGSIFGSFRVITNTLEKEKKKKRKGILPVLYKCCPLTQAEAPQGPPCFGVSSSKIFQS